ncbi:glycoside hydrolase family 3 C-terminal domain-containing protein [Kitasatospora sp. NBC_00240]|uniref:glycoside hydrolase family 3 C-terminal domain-containing protein n=1 Tax=Kitasatospora sp. NBC_00240 TaxID=2903567 RepID=UPI002253E27E|nr:glycoside hydrolase family 3 C-terminal domain-containing protein [Kitasatospora sp. NBC_00240]MCX5209954.1 glycoside hydrolase family 3 C-terminal domain-containing protein [Kitasatospora sp. NBC_00240]
MTDIRTTADTATDRGPAPAAPDLAPAAPKAAALDAAALALDLDRKAALVSGGGTFRTSAEPALGLRPIITSDGPVGVRGERWDESDTALALPSVTAMAAGWDEDLVRELGALLAAEARRKGVDMLLAPTLNLHRSPLAGRHFECFSEDPLLTGRIGAAYIEGVQSGGVAATAKHYVANDSETERLTLDARVDERTLREVYLAPFEAAVRAGVWAVMSAYNRVNGESMSESSLLAEPLKGEWGFDGLVVSDWGAIRNTAPSGSAGVDLAMPGPNEHWAAALAEAVRSGLVSEAALDDKVRRLLRLAGRVCALDGPATESAPAPTPADDTTRGLLRRAAAAAAVLLHNRDAVLPLDAKALRRVAVIGPNAATARVQGGGSAAVFPASVVSPLEGIRAALPDGVLVGHAAGVRTALRPTPLEQADCRHPGTGEPGLLARYLDADGRELHREHRPSGRVLEPSEGAGLDSFGAVEVSTVFRAPTAGRWRIGVVGLGRIVLEADGAVLLDAYVPAESDDPTYLHVAPSFRQVELELTAGQEVALRARRTAEAAHGRVIVLAADPPVAAEAAELAAAVELARGADAVVVVVGTTDEHESEGFDRTTLRLPGGQDALVSAVAAANPATVVVVNTGGPVLLPWREEVAAVLLGWFPGQEGGDGLADVLFGRAEPGGRLPTSWPAEERDAPVLDTTPQGGVLAYTEGLHIGYRGWLRAGERPAYWFGHGLGYGAWEYLGLAVPELVAQGAGFFVRVALRNTGTRSSREVVQVYLARPGSGVERPVRWLAGFAAVRAEPGQRVEVDVPVDGRALQHWSVEDGRWLGEPGGFTVLAGPSSGELPLTAAVRLAGPAGR